MSYSSLVSSEATRLQILIVGLVSLAACSGSDPAPTARRVVVLGLDGMDHCGDDRLVPGILLSNKKLRGGEHRLYDLPVTILKTLGVAKPDGFMGRCVLR